MENKEIRYNETDLIVMYEFIQGEIGGYFEGRYMPGTPDTYRLWEVWIFNGDLNIIDVLTEDDKEAIIELLK